MTARIYGNPTTANKHQIAGTLSYDGSTKQALLIAFRAPSPTLTASATVPLFTSHESVAAGLSCTVGTNIVTLKARSTATNTTRTIRSVGSWAEGELIYAVITLDLVAMEEKIYLNGTQLGATITRPGGDSPGSYGTMKPRITGAAVEAADLDIVAVAIWAGSGSYALPTDAEIAAYVPGETFSGAFANPPRIATLASGTNGADADSLLDVIGTNHFLHVEGDTSDANGNHPIFIAAEEEEDLTASTVALSSKAAWLSYETNLSGAAYFIVGLASANTTDPSAAQVKNGLNQNASAATATASDVVSGIDGTQLLTGLTKQLNYKGFMTVETAEDVFSPVVSWTFTTPRIGVSSDPIYPPTSSPALWASQTAISASVAANEVPAIVTTAETSAGGILTVDLSDVEGFHVPVTGNVHLGWAKGDYSGLQIKPIINLE
jgi:hypothetical protein